MHNCCIYWHVLYFSELPCLFVPCIAKSVYLWKVKDIEWVALRMLVLRSVTVCSEPETNKRRLSKRHVILQVTTCYLIYSLGLNNFANAQGERAPPGVPPSQYQANSPPSPQGNICLLYFHIYIWEIYICVYLCAF